MERTYVFNQDGNNGNGGGSKFDIMAMLPNLMGSKGVDPGLLALLNQGRGSQDQWGGSWWFIWIILLWFCWGGNGFGNRFGNGGGLPAELNGDVGREYLMSAIQGNGNAINQLASSLNCSTQQLQSALCNIQGLIANVGNQVGMSTQQIINAFQSGNQAVLTQIADCCCKNQAAIERQGYESRLASCENMNTLTRAMEGNTRSLADAYREGFQALVAKMDAAEARRQQEALAAKDAEISTLKGEISQRNQNATILGNVTQQIAPIVASLQTLQGEVDKIRCSMPPTVAVPYPQLQAINTDCFRAAAFGAYAGDAMYGRGGCGCNNYWG
ncbi:hypothetical protein [Bacteroides stercoris]|jgi:hypothetical protein|uniref:hypothetical protein n=1 Tax=Bacteroides stercoris TaxID=46506 RepID=UPI002068B037|nr:MAG TPA: hypothetical protein [Bacteriophage sp.]